MYCERCGHANIRMQRVYGGYIRCTCERCGYWWHIEAKGFDKEE